MYPTDATNTHGDADGAARAEELRFLAQTGRLRHWRRGVSETLVRAGMRGDYTTEAWAATPWYGPLETWLSQETISDILINGPERDVVIVDRGARLASGITLHVEWVQFIQRQLLLRSTIVSPADPDAWPGNAVIGTADLRLRFAVTRAPASPAGPTLSLRVLPRHWRTLDDLVQEEILPREAANLLIEALRRGATVLVAGGTGSGKTTLTAALLMAIGAEKRVVTIEEARELPELSDSIAMEVLRSGLTFADCVRFALRQKPDLIVVGEARGPEALAMLQAAATGHPGIGTIHAPDIQSALKNLERMACDSGESPPAVVRGMLSSSAVPLIVAHIGRYGGRRRVGAIGEVRPSNAASAAGTPYVINELFLFAPHANQVLRAHHVQSDWGAGEL